MDGQINLHYRAILWVLYIIHAIECCCDSVCRFYIQHKTSTSLITLDLTQRLRLCLQATCQITNTLYRLVVVYGIGHLFYRRCQCHHQVCPQSIHLLEGGHTFDANAKVCDYNNYLITDKCLESLDIKDFTIISCSLADPYAVLLCSDGSLSLLTLKELDGSNDDSRDRDDSKSTRLQLREHVLLPVRFLYSSYIQT